MEVLEPTGAQRTARELVERLDLRAGRRDRPRVVAAMIAAVDGRASIDGRSGRLGHPEDRDLLRELRAGADAVLVGSATMKAERYANLLDADQRERRAAGGLSEHPVLATIDRSGRLRTGDVPLFGEPGVPIRVYREDPGGGFDDAGAALQVVALGRGAVDFPAVLADLRDRDGVRGVACEGGPLLLRQLVAQGCLDDLLLTVSPLLTAGSEPSIIEGESFDGPIGLELVDVHRADQHLFLHYVPAS